MIYISHFEDYSLYSQRSSHFLQKLPLHHSVTPTSPQKITVARSIYIIDIHSY